MPSNQVGGKDRTAAAAVLRSAAGGQAWRRQQASRRAALALLVAPSRHRRSSRTMMSRSSTGGACSAGAAAARAAAATQRACVSPGRARTRARRAKQLRWELSEQRTEPTASGWRLRELTGAPSSVGWRAAGLVLENRTSEQFVSARRSALWLAVRAAQHRARGRQGASVVRIVAQQASDGHAHTEAVFCFFGWHKMAQIGRAHV